MKRRSFLHLAAGGATMSFLPRFARAQTYPTRPVRIIVSFPPGGPTDITARVVGQTLSNRLGQGGASGNIGTEAVVHAPPDGYTLLLTPARRALDPQHLWPADEIAERAVRGHF